MFRNPASRCSSPWPGSLSNLQNSTRVAAEVVPCHFLTPIHPRWQSACGNHLAPALNKRTRSLHQTSLVTFERPVGHIALFPDDTALQVQSCVIAASSVQIQIRVAPSLRRNDTDEHRQSQGQRSTGQRGRMSLDGWTVGWAHRRIVATSGSGERDERTRARIESRARSLVLRPIVQLCHISHPACSPQLFCPPDLGPIFGPSAISLFGVDDVLLRGTSDATNQRSINVSMSNAKASSRWASRECG